LPLEGKVNEEQKLPGQTISPKRRNDPAKFAGSFLLFENLLASRANRA